MPETPALHGGVPVRPRMLPYGHQWIDEEDVTAVAEVLASDYITTGPAVRAFEQAFAARVGARHAIAVSSGTAALHAAVHAAGMRPGNEGITTPLTFAADANAILYEGGRPVFADVSGETLLIDPGEVERKITPRTRVLIAVDYAGQPADIAPLKALAERHGLVFIEDACHSLGARYDGRPVGSLAPMTVFSFHPVKHVTTAEGGMVTTDDDEIASRLRIFRNHGITTTPGERATWEYEMVDLGYNYRLSDVHSALGLAQLRRLDAFIERRREIAAAYDRAFEDLPLERPVVAPGRDHVWHLYVIQLDLARLRAGRAEIFAALRAENIGVNVHYIPVPHHPYYRERLGMGPGLCPAADAAYERILTLPVFPKMSPADVEDVIAAVRKVVAWYRR